MNLEDAPLPYIENINTFFEDFGLVIGLSEDHAWAIAIDASLTAMEYTDSVLHVHVPPKDTVVHRDIYFNWVCTRDEDNPSIPLLIYTGFTDQID